MELWKNDLREWRTIETKRKEATLQAFAMLPRAQGSYGDPESLEYGKSEQGCHSAGATN